MYVPIVTYFIHTVFIDVFAQMAHPILSGEPFWRQIMGADVPGEGFGKGAGVASSSSTAASYKDGAPMPPPAKKVKGHGSDSALSLPHGTPEKPPEEPLVNILNFKFLAITVDPLTSQEFLLHRTTAELYTLLPCDTKYEVYNFGGEGFIYLHNKAIWARDILQWVPKHSETADRKFKETDKLNMDKVVITLSERAKAKASDENRHCRVGLPDFMCCAKYSMAPVRIADHANGQIEIKVLSLMRGRGGVATFWSLRDLYLYIYSQASFQEIRLFGSGSIDTLTSGV